MEEGKKEEGGRKREGDKIKLSWSSLFLLLVAAEGMNMLVINLRALCG